MLSSVGALTCVTGLLVHLGRRSLLYPLPLALSKNQNAYNKRRLNDFVGALQDYDLASFKHFQGVHVGRRALDNAASLLRCIRGMKKSNNGMALYNGNNHGPNDERIGGVDNTDEHLKTLNTNDDSNNNTASAADNTVADGSRNVPVVADGGGDATDGDNHAEGVGERSKGGEEGRARFVDGKGQEAKAETGAGRAETAVVGVGVGVGGGGGVEKDKQRSHLPPQKR